MDKAGAWEELDSRATSAQLAAKAAFESGCTALGSYQLGLAAGYTFASALILAVEASDRAPSGGQSDA